jgi:predicted transcriptional regulator
MTKLLDRAVAAARSLSADAQDDIPRLLLRLTGDEGAIVALTPEEKAAIERSRAAAAHGEFASDEEVQAVWSKHGL